MTTEPGVTDATESVVKLPVNWSRGDAYRLERTKEREDFGTENPRKFAPARSLIDVLVLRQLEDGYVIRWSYRKPELDFGSGPDEPRFDDSFLSEVRTLAGDYRVDMRTDALGSVVGLENPDEVAGSLRDAFDLLIRQLRQKGAPPERLGRLEDFTASFMTPEMVEIAALKEPELFYALAGGTYRLGTPATFEGSLPNPLGGPPIPAKQHVLLREVMPEEHSAVIEMRTTFDPDGLRKSFHDAFKAMGERTGRPMPKLPDEKDFPAVQVEDFSRFVIDTETGWPRSFEYERNAVFGPRGRVDRLVIRTLEDTRIYAKEDFTARIAGKSLTYIDEAANENPDIKVEISDDGTWSGRGLLDDNLQGTWWWEGSYYCRRIIGAARAPGEDCQIVFVEDDIFTVIRDRGRGDELRYHIGK